MDFGNLAWDNDGDKEIPQIEYLDWDHDGIDRTGAKVNTKSKLAPGMTYPQKCHMLQFWELNTCYGNVDSTSKSTKKKLWDDLTEILNNCDGEKRTSEEWTKVWNRAKCDFKTRPKYPHRLTNFDKRFAKYLARCEGKISAEGDPESELLLDNLEDNEMEKVEYLDFSNQSENEDDDAKIATLADSKKMFIGNRYVWRTTYTQKFTMLRFWERNCSDDPILRDRELKTIGLWDKLTHILNNCDGPKRTKQQWMKVWIDAKCILRKKTRAKLTLTKFEEQLAKFMWPYGQPMWDGPLMENSPNMKTIQSKPEAENVGNEEMDDEEYLCSKETKYPDGFKNTRHISSRKKNYFRTTFGQMCKMIDFWQSNIMDYKKWNTLGVSRKHSLWNELTRILNSCDGPTRTRKEWTKVWADAKCKVRRRLGEKLPLTKFDRKFVNFCAEHELYQGSSEEFMIKRHFVDQAAEELTEISTPEPQPLFIKHKYKMLDFWKTYIDFTKNGSPEDRKKKKVTLWDKLTWNLNLMEGPKKTSIEWAHAWTCTKRKTMRKHMEKKELSFFESKLLEFMLKFEDQEANSDEPMTNAPSMASGLSGMENVIEVSTSFSDNDKDDIGSNDISNSNNPNKEEENILSKDILLSPIYKHNTHIQKPKLLEFWKSHNPKGEHLPQEQLQTLWLEVTKMLNDCEGPKKSSNDWCKVWSAWKKNVRKKIVLQQTLSKSVDRSMAKYLCENDSELKLKLIELEASTETEEKYVDGTVVETKGVPHIQIGIDSHHEICKPEHSAESDEYNFTHELFQKNIKSAHIEGIEIQKETLELNKHHLEVQKQMLSDREELVLSLNEGLQLVMDLVHDVLPEEGLNTILHEVTEKLNFNSDVGTIERKNIVINNLIPFEPNSTNINEVNEFESFARNVALQLKMLPLQYALETKHLIENVLKEQYAKI